MRFRRFPAAVAAAVAVVALAGCGADPRATAGGPGEGFTLRSA